MVGHVCSKPACLSSGTLVCARCRTVRYCGQACQISQWSAHKAACKATSKPAKTVEKSNCYILRAEPRTASNNAPGLDDATRAIPSFQFWDETKEKRQLEKHLGWKCAMEVGKFYDHLGSDGWYYYVYGSEYAFKMPKQQSRSINEAAGLVCQGGKKKVYGDVAIVRSGPMGSEYAEVFAKSELASAVGFYRGNDVQMVFRQREMSRAKRSFGGWEDGYMPRHVDLSELLTEEEREKYL